MHVLLFLVAGFVANCFCAGLARADLPLREATGRAESVTPVSDAAQSESTASHQSGGAIAFHLGVGTPYGLAGVAFDARIVSWFAIEAGAGGSARNGAQFGVMPRLRIPVHNGALTLGSGVSTGRYSDEPLLEVSLAYNDDEWGWYVWDRAVWSNTEAGIEVPMSGMVSLRAYGGFAAVLNEPDRCEPSDLECGGSASGLPYIGVSFGVRLW